MRAHLFPALLLTMIALPSISSGQNGTGTAATTVAATPTSVTVGGTVGLTASVQANSVSAGKAVTKPIGSITFLDGSTLFKHRANFACTGRLLERHLSADLRNAEHCADPAGQLTSDR